MTESTPEPASAVGQPATEQPVSSVHWKAPNYDLHPPAETPPIGAEGASQFGGSASAASIASDRDQTTVLPVVDDGSALVWPELRGTPSSAAGAESEPLLSSALMTALQGSYDAAPGPVWSPPAQRARATQSVTCPQCGTVVPVDPQSRSSLDFCPNPVCDFPLFWVKTAVVDDGARYGEGSSHRRLPGAAGRAVSASMACPHCTELNPISGVVCVRCGLDLHPIAAAPPAAPPPPPETVYIAQEIDDPINWWLIILVGALIVLFFAGLTFVAVAYLVN
jgi:hypothetical protein